MRTRNSTVPFRAWGISLVLLAGCAAPREPVEQLGPAPAPVGTRGPSTATIARIEPGGHTAPIWRIDTDAAERILVTGSDDKTVRLWSLPDGALGSGRRSGEVRGRVDKRNRGGNH